MTSSTARTPLNGAGPSSPEARPDLLTSNRAALRAITFNDYELIRSVELSGAVGPTWRHHGATPSPEAFVQRLWAGVLTQFVIERGGRPVGTATCYDADFQNGHAYFATLRFPRPDADPAFGVGLLLFLNYVFTCWNFRKLYVEVAEFNVEQFASVAARWLDEEGRLHDHVYLDDRYWDLLTYSLSRQTWADRIRPLADQLLGAR